MDIRRKMALFVIASILLTAIPASILVFNYAQAKVLNSETAKLLEITQHQVDIATQRFMKGRPKLESLARLLQQELAKPIQADELATFHALMELNPDGVWRNRKPPFDGKFESGVFLPANPPPSDKQKIMHLRIKRIMDVFGAAATKRMENVWFLSPQRSEIIFDTTFPNFAFDQQADNDYTATPWVINTSPAHNPQREFGFTPPLFDPVPKVWMVSAIYPLYLEDQWLGTLGEDMQLSNVLEFQFKGQQLYPGSQSFLLDDKATFVLAGDWQSQLEASTNAQDFDLGLQPELKAALQVKLDDKPRLLSDNLNLNGRLYVAIGMNVAPVNWHYFSLIPVDAILQSTRQLFIALVSVIFLVSIMSGLLIGLAVHSIVVRRIRLLSNAMRLYEQGEKRNVFPLLPGSDEISLLANEFDVMMARVEHNLEQIHLTSAALKTSEERWQFALEGVGDGVWDWNVKSGVAIFSKRWKQMIGYAEHEFPNLASAWEAQLHPEDKPLVFNALSQYFANPNQQYAVEFRLRHKNGDWIWILARGMVVSRDDDGNPLRFIGTHTDITERKRLDAERDRLLQIVHDSPDFIGMADNQGYIIYQNIAAQRMLGLPEDTDFSKKHISDMHSEAAAKLVLEVGIPTLLKTGSWQSENTLLHSDGHEIPIQQLILVHRDAYGEPEFFSTIIRDISAFKDTEHALQQAKELAESHARSKSAFLANMSHEIRTPMNAIIGLSQLALNKPLSDEVRDYVQKINFSSESLLGILNDILDISKIEVGKLSIEPTPFNLVSLLGNLYNLFSVRAEQKQLEFIIEPDSNIPTNLIGDALRIQQVLSNLLSNAIKFTATGRVALKLHLLEQNQEQVRILFRITDTGIGINPEDQEKLFQPFNQVDNSITRRFGGTGLGLAISHSLLQMMESDFHIDSMPNHGTTFSFDLLLQTALPGSVEPCVTTTKSHKANMLSDRMAEYAHVLAGLRILVAEDVAINQQVVTEFLQLAGAKVDIANNGREALQLLENNRYSAILMDIHMPEMDGFEATRCIRRKPKFAALPIIALTAGVTPDERNDCIESGMNDFVAKPIDPEQLMRVLMQFLAGESNHS